MHIMLTGGGTLGPVTPLLAVQEVLATTHPDIRWSWIGTTDGPEKLVVESAGISFFSIPSGKFRRYASWKNFSDIYKILCGFFSARTLLNASRPDLVISAGGFVSVPVVWAAWTKKIPVHIHQQDVRAGLANKLCVPFVRSISVALKELLSVFPPKKTVWVGNPVRPSMIRKDRSEAFARLGLDATLPVVAVLGGGTGAARVNELIAHAAPALCQFAQVFHITGKGKAVATNAQSRYHQREFVTDEMADLLAVMSVAVTRAGMGMLSELAVMRIPSIIFPMHGTHQEENARAFTHRGAGVYGDEQTMTPHDITEDIRMLILDDAVRQKMQSALVSILPNDSASRLATYIFQHYYRNYGQT